MSGLTLARLIMTGQCETACPQYERLSAIFEESEGGVRRLLGDSLHTINAAHESFLLPGVPRAPVDSDDDDNVDSALDEPHPHRSALRQPSPSPQQRDSRSPPL